MNISSGKKQILLYLFIIVIITTIGLTGSGALMTLFSTEKKVEQNQFTLNQTQLYLYDKVIRDNMTRHEDMARINQTLHEDMAREQQMIYENEQRDIQRYKIVNETNYSIQKVEDVIGDLVKASEQRALNGSMERKLILNEILNNSDQHNHTSAEHNKILRELGVVIQSTNNITNTSQGMLRDYGDNSIDMFIEIRDLAQKILDILTNSSSQNQQQ